MFFKLGSNEFWGTIPFRWEQRILVMKVILESNLSIANIFEPPLELRFNKHTCSLRDFIQKVGDMVTPIQLMKDGQIGDDLRNIMVNGKDYFFLSKGLDTMLKDGDRVNLEIYMEPLGGG